MKVQNICIYCGSGDGKNPEYRHAAAELGTILAREGIGLVYGGGTTGLMGEVMRTVIARNGHVCGIIPDFLHALHPQETEGRELHVTSSMHERKQAMFSRSDAFVALPGGIGTLEEIAEIVTWAQLKRHQKPVIFLNIKGYWNPLLALFEHMVRQEFSCSRLHTLYTVVERAADVLPSIEAHP